MEPPPSAAGLLSAWARLGPGPGLGPGPAWANKKKLNQ